MEGIDENMPVIRDLDSHTFIRIKDGCYMAGGFETQSRPVFEDGALPMSIDDSELEVFSLE